MIPSTKERTFKRRVKREQTFSAEIKTEALLENANIKKELLTCELERNDNGFGTSAKSNELNSKIHSSKPRIDNVEFHETSSLQSQACANSIITSAATTPALASNTKEPTSDKSSASGHNPSSVTKDDKEVGEQRPKTFYKHIAEVDDRSEQIEETSVDSENSSDNKTFNSANNSHPLADTESDRSIQQQASTFHKGTDENIKDGKKDIVQLDPVFFNDKER